MRSGQLNHPAASSGALNPQRLNPCRPLSLVGLKIVCWGNMVPAMIVRHTCVLLLTPLPALLFLHVRCIPDCCCQIDVGGSCLLSLAAEMVAGVGPLATIICEPRQARKGATAAVDSGAGVWLALVASIYRGIFLIISMTIL